MSFILPQNIDQAVNLTIGTTVLYSGIVDRIVSIGFIKVSSTSSNTVTLTLSKGGSPFVVYTFNLDAGDVLVDTSGYNLSSSDFLEIDVTAASTLFYKGAIIATNNNG